MKWLIVGALLCVFVGGCFPPENGGKPTQPTYIGNWGEQPAKEGEGKTLHLNQPNECSCGVAVNLRFSPTAVFFNDLNTAHNTGFTKHCPVCASLGTQCQELLPPQQ